ncbi:MAG TPA: RpiB/LacA/LacB family sugar-phosphate isomerase [Patescibacteria group bacterium]|nr:RpiB/LacA/LacB family sugar-phosphate isomerase [Patescibacteria group bacterium]
MIYIGSDHGGFGLKEKIKQFLKESGHEYVDVGPFAFDPADDYPDYARLVAEKVSGDPSDFGILICRSGQGVNITANKFKGVRSALVWNEKESVASKSDDMVNILALPSDYITDDEGIRIVKVWLETPWPREGRHVRRVEKIREIETENFK